jgi:hypothetical protein
MGGGMTDLATIDDADLTVATGGSGRLALSVVSGLGIGTMYTVVTRDLPSRLLGRNVGPSKCMGSAADANSVADAFFCGF